MSADAPQTASGLTLRSLLIGCVIVVLISLGAPHSIWTFGSTEITWSFFPAGVGFLFICLISSTPCSKSSTVPGRCAPPN